MFQPKHGLYAESLKRAFPGVPTLLKNGVSRSLFLSGKNESFVSVAKATKGFLQTNKQTERMNTVEFRFFEPPREIKIGLKSRKFENSKACYRITPIWNLAGGWTTSSVTNCKISFFGNYF